MRSQLLLLALTATTNPVIASPAAGHHFSPRDVSSRNSKEDQLISLQKAAADATNFNVALAQEPHQGRFDYAMKWVTRATALPALGYALYGLAGDCKEYNENGDSVSGNKCVANGVWTAVSTIMCMQAYSEWAIEFGRTIQHWTINRNNEMVGQMLNDLNIGPYLRSGNEGNPNPMMRKRELVLREAEEKLSAKLGLETRHIGMWDGSMPGMQTKRGAKKQQHPVFAFKRGGQDYHVAFMDVDPASGEGKIKLGHGPGPQTELNNRHLLEGRQDGQYNQQYFDRGGLDGFGMTALSSDEGNLTLEPENDMQWLHDELVCSLEVEGPGSGYTGLWWGILDHEYRTTYSMGALAAFAPGVESIISYMDYEGHLPQLEQCLVADDFYERLT